MKTRKIITIFTFTVALLLIGVAGVALAASVTPTVIPGPSNTNKTCAVVMPGTFELKIEPVSAPGTTQSDGYLSATIVVPSTAATPNSFDWSTNYKVLGVIVKDGEDGANWYDYTSLGGSTGDTNLQTPNNGGKGISHISFCYKPALAVSKDANTTFTRTFHWTIDKSVTPEKWDLFRGDSGTSQYTVAVTKDAGTDSNWAVNGTITIHNPHPTASATIEGVTDSVDGIPATVVCPVSFPYTLAPGGTLTCTYSTPLPNGINRTNTATVTTSGAVDGGTGTADVIFGAPTTVVNGSVTVTDTNALFGGPKTASSSTSWSYSRTFACDADEGKHENTAAITETGQSDDASVTVNCYALEVDKDAKTSFKRTYTWTIDKWADQTKLTLSIGQQFEVNYKVTVDASYSDSGWAVSGNVTVHNPAPMAATINSVSDAVSGVGAATVNCGVTFPYTLAASGTLNCTYNLDLPNANNRTNTATATLQNYAYDKDGVGTAGGTTNFTKAIDFNFSSADKEEIDECIDVSDTLGGGPTEVCYGDLPMVWEYMRYAGPYDACGDYKVYNIASFATNDTGATGSAKWEVAIHVPCPGCTLTPGYWKTHSEKGPAPYDDTWGLLPNGADTTFYLSEKTYYEVLWTPPQGGNAYYILAHQFIAAKLNQLNGASSTPQVDAALVWAESFFNTYGPSDQLSKSTRNTAVNYAFILDQYNNGNTGPGHCSESDFKRTSLLLYFDHILALPVIRH